jgi:phosphoribosylglycinamide formyltransferase-1
VTSSRKKVAVLISGRGSNLAALIEASRAADYPAEIAIVISNNPDAGGLAFAERAAIPASVIDPRAFPSKPTFEEALNDKLHDHAIDLVCLAGFMRLLSTEFVELWRDRIINIHPSLLPLFPGLHTHERALAAGVRIHGATVHFVCAETDSGPIIAQAAVPVLSADTPQTLAGRVLTVEHRLYPLALKLVAGGNARVVDERVLIDGAEVSPNVALFSPE